MEFKTTDIKPRTQAMTLVEVIVCTAIGSVLMAIVAIFVIFSARSFVAMANYADLEYASRNALDKITSTVRQTKGFREYTATKVTLIDMDEQNLEFEYVPDDETLYMRKGGYFEPLLTHCVDLKFDCKQRNPESMTWDQFDTISTNLSTYKVLKIGWVCSRDLPGTTLFNTEIIQTTRIVIRCN